VIDYFSPDDLETILTLLKNNGTNKNAMLEKYMNTQTAETVTASVPEVYQPELAAYVPNSNEQIEVYNPQLESNIEPSYLAQDEPEMSQPEMLDDRSSEEVEKDDNSDLYNINNFTI
jgi:uncharacterized glyoxalase superfamily metalloenzyme YdcJ